MRGWIASSLGRGRGGKGGFGVVVEDGVAFTERRVSGSWDKMMRVF